MPLPILESPKYTVTIPSSKKKVEYRPYLVREEKILMLALESEDENQMMGVIKDIIRACTFGKLDPDDLTTTDLEYVFLKLRAKSIGETVSITLKCTATPNCPGSISADINLDAIEPIGKGGVSNRLALSETIGITLRPVTVRTLGRLKSMSSTSSKSDQINALIAASIESIFDEKGVYRAEDHTPEELTAFIDSLTSAHLDKVRTYIESLPRLYKEIDYTCPKCTCRQSITLSGLQSFFG